MLLQRKLTLNIGNHSGTLVCHLLRDLKVPGSNLDKDLQFFEIEMKQDV